MRSVRPSSAGPRRIAETQEVDWGETNGRTDSTPSLGQVSEGGREGGKEGGGGREVASVWWGPYVTRISPAFIQEPQTAADEFNPEHLFKPLKIR